MRKAAKNKWQQGSEAQNRTEENTGEQNWKVEGGEQDQVEKTRAEQDGRKDGTGKNKTGHSRTEDHTGQHSAAKAIFHSNHIISSAVNICQLDFSRTSPLRPLKPETQKRTEAKSRKKDEKRSQTLHTEAKRSRTACLPRWIAACIVHIESTD